MCIRDSNGEVATHDVVGYRLTISANLTAGSALTTEQVDNMVVTATLPAGAIWNVPGGTAGNVPGCLSSSGHFASILTCSVQGPITTGDAVVLFAEALVTPEMSDGDLVTMAAEVNAEAVSDGQPVTTATDTADDTVVRTYSPDINIFKAPKEETHFNGLWEVVRDTSGLATHVDVHWPLYLTPEELPSGNVKGWAGLPDGDVTFTDTLANSTPAGLSLIHI